MLLAEWLAWWDAVGRGQLFDLAPSGAPFDGDNFFARVFKPAACAKPSERRVQPLQPL
jgi:hypothetical protein